MSPLSRSHFLLLPLVLLTIALIEQVASYKLKQHVRDIHLRAGLIMALDGAGFGVAAALIGPWIRTLLVSMRSHSHRSAGSAGPIVFYGLAYAAVYSAYLIVERQGPAGLLPVSWR
jgi:hypothetical protein